MRHKIKPDERKNGYIVDNSIFKNVAEGQEFDCVELHKADGSIKIYKNHRVSSRSDAIYKDGKFRTHSTTSDRMDGLSEVYGDLAVGVTEIDVIIKNNTKKPVLEVHEIYDDDAKDAAAAILSRCSSKIKFTK